MKKSLLLVLIITSHVFSQLNITKTGQYNDGTSTYSDVWGFEKSGKDYVVVAKQKGYGFSIYEIGTDGKATVKVDFINQINGGFWSEPRYYNKNGKDYIYISTEYGPVHVYDVTGFTTATKVGQFGGKTHNIFYYKDMIFAAGYVTSSSTNKGVECWSLANPESPTLLWTYEDRYVHDLSIQEDPSGKDILYLATGAVGQSSGDKGGRIITYDITSVTGNKLTSDKKIIEHSYPGGFTHNIYPTPDGKYVVTTDEHDAFDHIQFWDISDPNNVKNLWKHREGSASIVHNAFIKNDYIFASYYDRGLVIFDISDKDAIVKIGEYDTYPEGQDHSQGDFQGAWGVYPFLTNDYIAVSDQTHGLVMLHFDQTIRSGALNVTLLNSNNEPITQGISIRTSTDGESSLKYSINSNVVKLKGKPDLTYPITISAFGYQEKEISYKFNQSIVDTTIVLPSSEGIEMKYYIFHSTETSLKNYFTLMMYFNTPITKTPEITVDGADTRKTIQLVEGSNDQVFKASFTIEKSGTANFRVSTSNYTKTFSHNVTTNIAD